MIILTDLDDTMWNLVECWVEILNERYGTSVRTEDVTEWNISPFFPELSRDSVYSILNDDELWARVTPFEGCAEALTKLKDAGHTICVVTATNPRRCNAKIDRMLKLFPMIDKNDVIITHHKQMVKGDILIDDYPPNLLGGEYAGVLFDAPHNRSFNTGSIIKRVHGWDEVVKYVEETIW